METKKVCYNCGYYKSKGNFCTKSKRMVIVIRNPKDMTCGYFKVNELMKANNILLK